MILILSYICELPDLLKFNLDNVMENQLSRNLGNINTILNTFYYTTHFITNIKKK